MLCAKTSFECLCYHLFAIHRNHEQAVSLKGLTFTLAIMGKSVFSQPPSVKCSLCLKGKCQWNM